MEDSRWKCPECGSHDVQISLPTWYREKTDGQLEFVETDAEADVMWWYCPDCDESGMGQPDEVE